MLSSQWICASYRFALRRAVFVISDRDTAIRGILPALKAENPEEVLSVLEKVLLKERPELQGAVISFFEYCLDRAVWRLGVYHNALSETPDGESAREFPFRKEVWAEELVETPELEIQPGPVDVGTKNNWAEDEIKQG